MEESPPLKAGQAHLLKLFVGLPLEPVPGLQRGQDRVLGRRGEDGTTIPRLLQWRRHGRCCRGWRVGWVGLDDAHVSQPLGEIWLYRVVRRRHVRIGAILAYCWDRTESVPRVRARKGIRQSRGVGGDWAGL